jgi:SAM-dependent methyltransferase
MAENIFKCDDGREVRVVPGMRERILHYRRSVSPRAEWTDEDYAAATAKKVRRGRRLIETVQDQFGSLGGSEILEIGCGDSINSVFLALQPVKKLVGIDIDMRIRQQSDSGERVRKQVGNILEALGQDPDIEAFLERQAVDMVTMDATRMDFADDSFDLIISRSAMEHIKPIEQALEEMARVARPGGMIHHNIDPFYWIRGCHKRGVVDIPWAHSRLNDDDIYRFVVEHEGDSRATKVLNRIQSLNRLTVSQWRELIEAGPYEIVDWQEQTSEFATEIFREYPEVGETLLEGVGQRDLVTSRIDLWLRVTG